MNASNPIILIIDDDPITQLVVDSALESVGHRCIGIMDPLKVKDVAFVHEIAAIILDLNMPGMSGWDVLHWIRLQPGLQKVPVLMLSADGAIESRIQGLRRGADDFLLKPFDVEEFLARVDVLLGRRQQAMLGMHGDLATNSLPELLQGMGLNGKSGRLEVTHGNLMGYLRFADGLIVEAEHRGLKGRSAAISLLEVDTGRFSIDAGAQKAATSASLHLGVQELVMDFAWLQDELLSRSELLPARDEVLIVTGSYAVSGGELGTLPIDAIREFCLHRVDATLRTLIETPIAAASETKLAVAWLLQEGDLRVVSDPEPEDSAATIEVDALDDLSDLDPVESLDMALRELLQGAIHHGYSIDHLEVLLCFAPEVKESLLGLIQQIPSQWSGAGQRADLLSRLLGEQGGDLDLTHESGRLNISFQVARLGSLDRYFSENTVGAVLWLGGAELPDAILSALIENFERLAGDRAPLILVAAGGTAGPADVSRRVRGRGRWVVAADPDPDLTSLLTSLASSL